MHRADFIALLAAGLPEGVGRTGHSPRGLFAVIALSSALATITGCSTSQSVGSYVDDTVITTKVKAKFAETKDVDR